MKLGKLRSLTGSGVPWVALTATASSPVVEDIHKQLSLKRVKRFKVPCFRPNLFYDVQFRDIMRDEFEDVKDFAIASLGGDGWEENRDRGGGDSMDIWNLGWE